MLAEVCDQHLRDCITIEPRCVAGVGGYAAGQARRVVSQLGLNIPVPCLLHPSPANPLANRNWEALAEAELSAAGVEIPELAQGVRSSGDTHISFGDWGPR